MQLIISCLFVCVVPSLHSLHDIAAVRIDSGGVINPEYLCSRLFAVAGIL